MKLTHFFLPHPETHKKAHLISWQGIFVYILLFVILQLSIQVISKVRPGVLGIESSIDQRSLIELTNRERAKFGLPELRENSELNKAAEEKGKNMLAEDYWAHYSPSGKDPWGFIQSSGYKFSYAGENLARNFYNSPDVVQAWMASPTHRDNILNSHYQEVGIAVLHGVLKGQETTLVIQEFGRPIEPLAQVPSKEQNNTPQVNTTPNSQLINIDQIAGQQKVPDLLVDPYKVIKISGLSLVLMFFTLLVLDIYILKRRAVYRVSARHLPHMAILSLVGLAIIAMKPGGIL